MHFGITLHAYIHDDDAKLAERTSYLTIWSPLSIFDLGLKGTNYDVGRKRTDSKRVWLLLAICSKANLSLPGELAEENRMPFYFGR